MAYEFKIVEGGLQDRFLKSTAKIQLYGGGFANGKTSAACIKAIQMAEAYPGSNGLIARATYPKLNDTIRKEFEKWCPKHWIKKNLKNQSQGNYIQLINGSTINFKYIAQQGKSNESSTSNLLSATYDWVIIDQIEDPEIEHKDFLDILGRLRGNTPYMGNDPKMPTTGPRFLIITTNPTRNWVYTKLVEPYHRYQRTGQIVDSLQCERDENGEPILNADGTAKLLLEIYEGSTYENKVNLAADFIKTLESSYAGQMKDRYLLGKWAGYEGLVYPQYSDESHLIPRAHIMDHIGEQVRRGYIPTFIEGYDYGLVVPACYMLAVIDAQGFTYVIDGFYQAELDYKAQIKQVREIRDRSSFGFHIPNNHPVFADPSIFNRKGRGGTIGNPTSEILWDDGMGFRCVRGNNDIINGITKVGSFLQVRSTFHHPLNHTLGSPRLFFATELGFLSDEINGYYWKTNTSGDRIDEPVDKNDHAMDTLKYMLSLEPEVGDTLLPKELFIPTYLKWNERSDGGQSNRRRY